MSALVCTCIRDTVDPRHVTIPDPTCHTHDGTAQADMDARRAATGLGRLLLLLAGLALIGAGITLAFTVAPMSGGHLIAAPALTILGATATYAAFKE